MDIVFRPDGSAACLHGEEIPLQGLGRLSTRRASTIEFCNAHQQWEVHLIGSDGRPAPYVFSDPSRDRCLAWEKQFFSDNPEFLNESSLN